MPRMFELATRALMIQAKDLEIEIMTKFEIIVKAVAQDGMSEINAAKRLTYISEHLNRDYCKMISVDFDFRTITGLCDTNKKLQLASLVNFVLGMSGASIRFCN